MQKVFIITTKEHAAKVSSSLDFNDFTHTVVEDGSTSIIFLTVCGYQLNLLKHVLYKYIECKCKKV